MVKRNAHGERAGNNTEIECRKEHSVNLSIRALSEIASNHIGSEIALRPLRETKANRADTCSKRGRRLNGKNHDAERAYGKRQ